jgi:hypothetical protein
MASFAPFSGMPSFSKHRSLSGEAKSQSAQRFSLPRPVLIAILNLEDLFPKISGTAL